MGAFLPLLFFLPSFLKPPGSSNIPQHANPSIGGGAANWTTRRYSPIRVSGSNTMIERVTALNQTYYATPEGGPWHGETY